MFQAIGIKKGDFYEVLSNYFSLEILIRGYSKDLNFYFNYFRLWICDFFFFNAGTELQVFSSSIWIIFNF